MIEGLGFAPNYSLAPKSDSELIKFIYVIRL